MKEPAGKAELSAGAGKTGLGWSAQFRHYSTAKSSQYSTAQFSQYYTAQFSQYSTAQFRPVTVHPTAGVAATGANAQQLPSGGRVSVTVVRLPYWHLGDCREEK